MEGSRFVWESFFSGAILAGDLRTASAWFQAAGVNDDWDVFYHALISIGRTAASIATPLLKIIVAKLEPGPNGYWKFVIDDSPTKRYGRHVEGANVHHHPTPGPADGEWLYGHNWVCLALLMNHSCWGTIALPILSMLYVRQCDVAALHAKYGWEFLTKHQLALQLVTRVASILRALGSKAKMLAVLMVPMRLESLSKDYWLRVLRSSVVFEEMPSFSIFRKKESRANAVVLGSMERIESIWRSLLLETMAGQASVMSAEATPFCADTKLS